MVNLDYILPCVSSLCFQPFSIMFSSPGKKRVRMCAVFAFVGLCLFRLHLGIWYWLQLAIVTFYLFSVRDLLLMEIHPLICFLSVQCFLNTQKFSFLIDCSTWFCKYYHTFCLFSRRQIVNMYFRFRRKQA